MRYLTSRGPALQLILLAGLFLASITLLTSPSSLAQSGPSAASQAARIDREWELRRQQVPSLRCRRTRRSTLP